MMHPGRLHGQLRNKLRWLKVGLPFLKTTRKESGAGDKDYINRAMIHYQIEIRLSFKYRYCWEVLKDSLKWKEIALLKFATELREGAGTKRELLGKKGSKSSGSSTMNDDALARLMVTEMTAQEKE
ncbi:hypothetical protein Tco_0918509 [Tanacetum coccineum]